MSKSGLYIIIFIISASIISAADIRDGEYWGLPAEYPGKSPYGGVFEIWQSAVRWRDNTDMQFIDYPWRRLNPSENTYDWGLIENKPGGSYNYGLNELRDNGKSALLFMALSEYEGSSYFVPQWVIDKCSSQGKPISVIESSDGRDILAIWEDCPKQELVKFIRQFVRYKNDPALRYAYMTTFRWGEFMMQNDEVDDAISKGLTGDVLKSFCKDYTDAWVYALGPDKLIWEGHTGWGPTTAGFKDATAWCNDYAVNQVGTNIREGLGNIGRFVNQPFLGQYFDSGHYLHAETVHDMGKGGVSFYGTEFTEGDLGIFDDYPYFRLSMLNMMRAGINYPTYGAMNPKLLDHSNDAAYPEFAALRDYYRQAAGYPVPESPDAWAILQQWSDYNCWTPPVRPNNYEKFLLQREISPDGNTVLVERKTWADNKAGFCPTRPSWVDQARRTDHATGNDYIYFNLDDDFLGPSEHDIQISVYYKDNNNAQWRIEYNAMNNVNYKQTEAVQEQNDGKWKSAIFTINDADFRNAQTSGQDFRIYNGGSKDVTIGSVRVIRLKNITVPNCQSSGYVCCDSCMSGPHTQFDVDCPGQVCCEQCASPTPTCPEGQITSACLCGANGYSAGFCCSGAWKNSPCTTSVESYTIKKIPTPPTIDGDLSEFSDADDIMVTSSSGTVGRYRLMWDDDALYIAAEFSDSQMNAIITQEDGNIWEDDSLEMMFDTQNDGGTAPKDDDYKFFVSVGDVKGDSRAYDMDWDSAFSAEVVKTGTINNNADTDTGYAVEAKIPWSGWVARPGDGTIWGMNIQLNDRTAAGRSSSQWSDEGMGVNQPDGWKDAVFIGVGSCGPADQPPYDNSIDIAELIDYINSWRDGDVGISGLMMAINQWKNGC